MATSGIFQLIVNTGMQDQIIMATELLNKRLREISRMRCKNPAIRDKTPTLVDIERTHVLFMNHHFKPFVAIGYEYQSIAPQGRQAGFGEQVVYSIPQFGDFFADMVLHIKLEGLASDNIFNRARYCDFLGHRLLQLVQFEVNGNVLDFYDYDLYNIHYNFFISQTRKELNWYRCVGQEWPKTAYVTGAPGIQNWRQGVAIYDGPQTVKDEHPLVELWMPLMFWFNRDSRLMIPSVSIPYGQRFIRVNFAEADLICQGVVLQDFTRPRITLANLHINNVFVNPEIHDIFIKRIGFQLIRVHRYQRVALTTGVNDAILLNNLKWPTETIYIGAKPDVNFDRMDAWWKFHFSFLTAVQIPAVDQFFTVQPTAANMEVKVPSIDAFRIYTHSINLYSMTPSEFFNAYVPYNYGKNIGSPIDIGLFMVTFNLYPGAYQPSGHINLSNIREFYFGYTSQNVSDVASAELLIYAIAINFLLINQGQAVLRYNV